MEIEIVRGGDRGAEEEGRDQGGGGAERTWTQRDGHAEREEEPDPERGRWWSRKVRTEAQRRGVE